MLDSIAVINGLPGRELASRIPSALVWKTCLREIAIADLRTVRAEDLRPEDEIYLRVDGYRFLLEVICGLHSPLVGENEVLGQFKDFALRSCDGPAARCAAPWMERLIADAKRVRAQHLSGIGGRSYGQIAQRRLADCARIEMLGSGRLARETIPCLAGHAVDLFSRRPDHVADITDRYSYVTIHAMDEPPASIRAMEPRLVGIGGTNEPRGSIQQMSGSLADPHSERMGLIVAAPMTAAEIVSWIERSGCRFHAIVDLRGESRTDRLDVPGVTVHHFTELLNDLESNQRFIEAKVERAKKEIRERAESFWHRYEVRPFGWEDLCA